MKSFLFRIYLNLIKLVLGFTRTDDHLYVVLNGAGRSGSNGYVFYQYLKKQHPEVEAVLVEPWPSSHLSWSAWLKIGRAKYLFTTHQPFKIKRDQICTCFWHGIPLKRMGFMAANDSYDNDVKNRRVWQHNADRVISSGDLYETLMSACVGIAGSKYRGIGFPRIDALLHPEISKAELLADLFKTQDEQAKIGVYMPTFRYELGDPQLMDVIKGGNFFAFQDFDGAALNVELAKLHQYLIVKLHPYEMKLIPQSQQTYSHLCFLSNDYLFSKKLDLYSLLGQTDYLLTDFSSIYFDYLHLNKPVFFVTNFLQRYEQVRGLLLTPYAEAVPGATVNNQEEMLAALANLEQDQYQAKRKYWLDLTYPIERDHNCERNFASLHK
ncbi:MAG: CDP-glycerol glycerophosphotransferase family protein [Lactobacillus sp.]|jgi:CDP-glycerol glycerophosphotransferase (TagB/SpsB family)|nr:CDP-glycerol glycerophosphotransferase family protein [Lactobacillus sp.]